MPYANPEDKRRHDRDWYARNGTKARDIRRRSYRKNREVVSEGHKRSRAANPEREYANNKFRFAVKRGWIVRPDGMQFHHPDYSRPYYGAWVTPAEHRQVHAGLIPCPTCTDYSEQVENHRREAIHERNRRGAMAANRKRWGHA